MPQSFYDHFSILLCEWLLSFLLQFQAGLFVYDIFWVFTPVMVSVAKSFDAPIKVNVLSVNSIFFYSHVIWFQFITNSSINLVLHFFCIASISNRRCCTSVLYAWPWWHCNTWLVIKLFVSFVSSSSDICSDNRFFSFWFLIE